MATGCVTGIEDLSTLDRGEETCVSKREVPQQNRNADGTDREVVGGGVESAPTRHPAGVSSTKDSVNAGDKKPLCRVTAYERTDVSNADQEASSSKANATKVKKKKKKKGKKKEAQEKRDVPSVPKEKGTSGDCMRDLERQIENLKIRQEGWIKQEELVERGPDRNRDSHEIRQSKPYQRTPDDDVSNFRNSIMPDDMMVIDKPTAEVSPQIRSLAPAFPQNQQQLQQHQQQLQQQQLHQFQQQQHLLQLQQLLGQQPQQQLQFPQQQLPQYMQQCQQSQQQQLQQQQLLSNSQPASDSAPPSIPFTAQSIPMAVTPYASSQMQGACVNNGGLASIPSGQSVILVPVQCQVNGQTFQYQQLAIVANQVPTIGSFQSSTQNLPPNAEDGIIVTASPQGQLGTNRNSQAVNDNPARQGIPTVVPDEFETEVLPIKKKGRGKTPNSNKKKTSKKSASKAKKSANEPSGADTAVIDAQSDSQCSGASAISSDIVRPGSTSSASATPKSTALENFEPQLDIPNSRNTCSAFSPLSSVESGSFRQGPAGPKSVGPASVQPGSVGPASIEPGSVGPVSVGPASVASSSVGPGSVCPESIGSNLDFSDFGPFSNGGSPSASNSVAPQSVGTAIEIEDDDSLDVSDFLRKGTSVNQVIQDSPSTKTCTTEDRDELFRIAEEFVESDLKEATASRQADMHSATWVLSQQGTACINESVNHATSGMQSGFSGQQNVSKDVDADDFLDVNLSALSSEVPGIHEAELVSSLEKILASMEQPSDDSVPTSEQMFHNTDTDSSKSDLSNASAPETPYAAASNVDATSNMAAPTSARSLDVSVCIEETPSAFWTPDNVVQSQLNIQIGMNRMSQQTSFNKIMGSFKPIVPKRTN